MYRRIILRMYLKLLIKVGPVLGKGVQGVSHQVYYCLVFAYFDIMSSYASHDFFICHMCDMTP